MPPTDLCGVCFNDNICRVLSLYFNYDEKMCLSLIRSEDANKAFSAAVQMHDVLVKAWAMWGDYLENIFVKERQLHLGVSAITCYLHACRHQNESKSRKYLAKVCVCGQFFSF